MARALKTFTTSAGFFDLAIAAPSMKAALEAWGARSNLFSQGLAKATDDPEIVRATRARPGVVLRRAVGSTGRFSEHAALPRELPVPGKPRRPLRSPAGPVAPPARPAPSPAPPSSDRAARDRRQADRDSQRDARAAARRASEERRKQAITAAQDALDEARRGHDARLAAIDRERTALDRRRADEQSQWRQRRQELEQALRRARTS